MAPTQNTLFLVGTIIIYIVSLHGSCPEGFRNTSNTVLHEENSCVNPLAPQSVAMATSPVIFASSHQRGDTLATILDKGDLIAAVGPHGTDDFMRSTTATSMRLYKPSFINAFSLQQTEQRAPFSFAGHWRRRQELLHADREGNSIRDITPWFEKRVDEDDASAIATGPRRCLPPLRPASRRQRSARLQPSSDATDPRSRRALPHYVFSQETHVMTRVVHLHRIKTDTTTSVRAGQTALYLPARLHVDHTRVCSSRQGRRLLAVPAQDESTKGPLCSTQPPVCPRDVTASQSQGPDASQLQPTGVVDPSTKGFAPRETASVVKQSAQGANSHRVIDWVIGFFVFYVTFTVALCLSLLVWFNVFDQHGNRFFGILSSVCAFIANWLQQRRQDGTPEPPRRSARLAAQAQVAEMRPMPPPDDNTLQEATSRLQSARQIIENILSIHTYLAPFNQTLCLAVMKSCGYCLELIGGMTALRSRVMATRRAYWLTGLVIGATGTCVQLLRYLSCDTDSFLSFAVNLLPETVVVGFNTLNLLFNIFCSGITLAVAFYKVKKTRSRIRILSSRFRVASRQRLGTRV